jgi:uncharacterized protein
MKTIEKSPETIPPEIATLYIGRVMHARLKPIAHRFQYKVFSLLIDIDRLAEAHAHCSLFSVNQLNIFSFYPHDHGDRGQHSLRDYINGLFRSENLSIPEHVFLLCYPRIFNFAFNPLSVFYCYDVSGGITGIIYEVRNTFGEHHSYFAPLKSGEQTEAGIKQERDKLFFVSPFMDMNLRYKFSLRPPANTVSLRIIENDSEGPVLSATFFGEKCLMNSVSLAYLLWVLPFQNFKIVAGIHWEAFKLWLKGMRLKKRPAPTLTISVDGIPKAASDLFLYSDKGLK